MPTAEHMATIGAQGNALRKERSDARRALRTGALSMEAVMRDPPPALAGVPLIDVVRLGYRYRNGGAITEIGRMALRDGVNLMMPLGTASVRSREWVARHGCRYWRPTMKHAS
jgi:hypothetical protein